jgi:hypothetical protein
MGIDVSVVVFIFAAAFVLGVINGLLDAMDSEADPLDLARSSITHLDREAERAMAELRAIDREEEP